MAKRLWVCGIIAAGCSNGAKMNPPDGDVVNPFPGGTIALGKCGYSVTTREGAAVPVLGTPMLGSDPKPWGIHLGLAADPTQSMVVSWRTQDDTTLATTVQFGVGDKIDQTVDGLTFAYETQNRAPVQIHETHLCNLLPNTTYSYRVGGKDGQGQEAWSAMSQFHTAPSKAQGDPQVVIALIGDTRGNYPLWGQMLQKAWMLAAPDLILFSGDAVTFGTFQSEWDDYFTQAEPVLRRVPMLIAHGNHDLNAVNFFSQFAMPGDEAYYGIDYGPMHLTVANDTPSPVSDLQTIGAAFLEKDFTVSESATWKFLLHHRPMYSAAVAHGGDMTILKSWGPIVDQHKIDMVFNGHDHNYERTKPMRAELVKSTPAEGTTYVVAGSAGAPLYTNGNGAWTAVSKKNYNLVILRVKVASLEMTAYDDQGNTLDTFTINK